MYKQSLRKQNPAVLKVFYPKCKRMIHLNHLKDDRHIEFEQVSEEEDEISHQHSPAGPKLHSNAFFAGLSAFWMATNTILTATLVCLVPLQILTLSGNDNKGSALSLVLLPGSFAGLISPIWTGSVSDKGTFLSKLGRRSPFIIIGTLVNSFALAICGSADSLPLLVIGFLISNISLSAALGPYSALIPDVVHESQRDIASGWMGLTTMVGSLLGGIFGFMTSFMDASELYWILIFFTFICAVITLLTIRKADRILPPPRFPKLKISRHSSRPSSSKHSLPPPPALPPPPSSFAMSSPSSREALDESDIQDVPVETPNISIDMIDGSEADANDEDIDSDEEVEEEEVESEEEGKESGTKPLIIVALPASPAQSDSDSSVTPSPSSDPSLAPAVSLASSTSLLEDLSLKKRDRRKRRRRRRSEKSKKSSEKKKTAWHRFVSFFKSFLEPFQLSKDFRSVFFSQFYLTMCICSVQSFLQYFFEDVFPHPFTFFGMVVAEDSASATAYCMIPLLVGGMISSIASGYTSGKSGRLRVMVTGIVTMLLGCLVLSFVRYFTIILITAFIMGIGFGIFSSVSWAMASDVLPPSGNTARDMALWGVGSTLPQMVAAPVSGVVLDFVQSVSGLNEGYICIFLISALYAFLGMFSLRHLSSRK